MRGTQRPVDMREFQMLLRMTREEPETEENKIQYLHGKTRVYEKTQ